MTHLYDDGSRFSPQLKSQVPEGMCYNVSPSKAKEQAAEVLNHYNVVVKQSDIFSRCQVSQTNRGREICVIFAVETSSTVA